jgi:hypothetical protein
MIKTVIIVALERELHPLTKGWARKPLECAGNRLWSYGHGDVVAVAGGIGRLRAALAARKVVDQFHPEQLISAGLAGSLSRNLKAGSVVTPHVVVDVLTGSEYHCNGDATGGDVLVSAGEIAGQDVKRSLAERYHGVAVDMEAAGVAGVAMEFNIGFRCVKAISDELDFIMPPLNNFVDSQGNFSTGKFLAWAALRPYHWPSVARLSRGSHRAIQALCDWLQNNVTGEVLSSTVVKLVPRLRGR